MTTFYLGLVMLNVACFLPLYALNFREQPNPLAFLTEDRFFNKNKLKLFYAKHKFTDPLRINFDATFGILILGWLGPRAWPASLLLALLLAFGFIEILYSSVMATVFRRAPVIASDLSLAMSGLRIIQRGRWLVVVAVAALTVIALVAAYLAVDALLPAAPSGHWSLLVAAAILVPPCLYHWMTYDYSDFLSRTVYSPLLHFVRNLQSSCRYESMLQHDEGFFEARNHFRELTFERRPTIVAVCIESYGAVAHRLPDLYKTISPEITRFSTRLGEKGYRAASSFSRPPIFAGGSWLSYASFMYGLRIDDARLYDLLFAQSDAFGAYESFFHVLKRNAYRNYLLCPLGGVDSRDVNWDSVDRCFQSDRNFDFDSLGFRGRRLGYFVREDTYCPPDEFSLNAVYERCRDSTESPFSLFFCTLNSHYPYDSPAATARHWRDIDTPGYRCPMTREVSTSISERYARAIRYQLEFVRRFLERNGDDDLLLILFGDHQPPMIATESDGLETPVHVICQSDTLLDSLLGDGFAAGLDPARTNAAPIHHEAFLSIIMRAMAAAYGGESRPTIPVLPNGVSLLDDS